MIIKKLLLAAIMLSMMETACYSQSSEVSINSIQGENATKNQEKLHSSNLSIEPNQIESFDFLNSENIKFSFIERDFGFDLYSPSISERVTDYLNATEYNLIEEFKFSEFERFSEVDSALAK